MKLISILTILFTLFPNMQTVRMGIIQNASLFLMNIDINTINETTCQNCVCKMSKNNGNFSIVSLNCFMKNFNLVTCELLTMVNYQTASLYQMQNDINSTFYFLQLPTKQQFGVTTERMFSIQCFKMKKQSFL
jgi:hypothetical protein